MDVYEVYSKPFKALWGVKLVRQHGESKKDFIKRCKANKRAYSKFMNTHYNVKQYTITQRMAKEEKYMVARWIKRHPQPEPDFFDIQQKWLNEKEAAVERIRDLIVSRYDKLVLIGRFKNTEKIFKEHRVAQLKDVNGEGHIINELNPKTSKLLQRAQTVTDRIHRRTPSLVCTILSDHKRKKGRLVLPRAA